MLNVKADVEEVLNMLNETERHHVPLAASAALNRTSSAVQTVARRELSKDMGVQQKRLKGMLYKTNASKFRLTAEVIGTGKPIKLIYFKGTRQLKAGVKSAAYNQAKTYPHTFISNMRSGHRGVFVRQGKGRLPIKELFGPGVPKSMVQLHIIRAMNNKGQSEFTKRFQHELSRRLNRSVLRSVNARVLPGK